jgi:toxin ParE2
VKTRLLEIAQIELDEAVSYYDSESAGLGKVFLLEVLSALERIRQYPNAWHPLSANTRRCRTRRFPFGIIYQVLENEILVVAVSNLHRAPDYWRDRLSRK